MSGRNRHIPASLRQATQPIYHYTSSEGLIGIVESNRLRASEASGLNDLAEVRAGWRRVRQWLAAEPKSEAVDFLRSLAEEPLQEEHEVFVLSASTAGDDANQWRLYANRGYGYAIELEPSVDLAPVSDSPARPRSPGRVGFRHFDDLATVTQWLHVIYDDDEAVKALMELVSTVEADIHSIESGATDSDERDEAYEVLRDNAYEALATIAHLIKAPGFSGENEVRMVATFLWVASHIKYRPGANGIVGYVTLTGAPKGHAPFRVLRPSAAGVPPEVSLPVKSIRLGPLLHDEHVSTVRAFLRNSGFKEASKNVYHSDVPLRG